MRSRCGQIGVDPGSYWGSDDQRTQDRTLRRREGTAADTDPFDSYDPAFYFDGFAVNSFDDLGAANDTTDPDTDPEPVEMAQRDSDPSTSEGLFIFDSQQQVVSGQRVRLAGTISEFFGLTEMTDLSQMVTCGVAELPAPVSISLPCASADAPEAFESMRVSAAEPLTVNDNYNLGRFGSLTLGSDLHFIPTNRRPSSNRLTMPLMLTALPITTRSLSFLTWPKSQRHRLQTSTAMAV